MSNNRPWYKIQLVEKYNNQKKIIRIHGLMVMMDACQVFDPGSIPGGCIFVNVAGVMFSILVSLKSFSNVNMSYANDSPPAPLLVLHFQICSIGVGYHTREHTSLRAHGSVN